MDNYNLTANNHFLTPNRSISFGLLLALTLSACQPTGEIATNAPESNGASANGLAAQNIEGTPAAPSTKTEFPHYINGIPTLVHPITPTNIEDSESDTSSIKSRKGDSYQPVFEQQSPYNFRTYASNFVFEEIATGDIQKLMPNNNFIISQVFLPHLTQYKRFGTKGITEDEVVADDDLNNIESDADYNADTEALREDKKLAINTPFNHIIYHISETPNKQDDKGKNIMRQQALYMSNVKGQQLIKLHPDNEYVGATEWMPQVSRYYFTTQSDSDGNGIINEKDVYHNYQINFKADKPVVRKYEF